MGFNGQSHIQIRGTLLAPNSRNENINVTFSTSESAGLLIWKSQKDIVGNGDDFILLEIENGQPKLTYELGGGGH